MPSVGMKRTTRVCRMKCSDARVLRSGRLVRPDFFEVKPKKRANCVEFNKKTPKSEVNKSAAEVNGKPKEENPKNNRTRNTKAIALKNGGNVDKMFGIVYTRKRKRNGDQKFSFSENSESKNDELESKVVSSPCFRDSKVTARSNIQKRSSLRRLRARNPFANGSLMSDLISSKRNGIPFSSVVSKNKLRSSIRDMTSSISDLMAKEESDSSQCCASILIIEQDRCYREEGAIVSLELSTSNEWVLVVKKDGSTKYTHKADKFMRPSAFNRFTRAVIWAGHDNWKLEFPKRQDWVVFKDLYKECCERNVAASGCRVIPVPGVCEVSGYDDTHDICFQRPDLYISFTGDEVSRALANKTANYDMDLEDEEWLKKFNDEFFSGNGHHEHLSEDCFELMVDAFEKAYFRSPDDNSNETAAAADLCMKEVVEAVHAYWLKKREQRQSSLLRVFQGHRVKKAPVVSQPLLRKRRSFKHQASHGRGKQPSLVQAMAAQQHDALEEENVMVKVKEAKAAASRSIESAILKRQKAQLLMQNADMATYKAVMALRIAEAASITESSEAAAAQFFLDEVPVVS